MHAFAGLADLSLQGKLPFKRQSAAGAFAHVGFQRGSLSVVKLLIDQRRDEFLGFLAVHLHLSFSCPSTTYAVRYVRISFRPRERRERTVPMGHDSMTAASSYENTVDIHQNNGCAKLFRYFFQDSGNLIVELPTQDTALGSGSLRRQSFPIIRLRSR